MKEIINKYKGYIVFGLLLAVALVLAFVLAPKGDEKATPAASSGAASSSAVQQESSSPDNKSDSKPVAESRNNSDAEKSLAEKTVQTSSQSSSEISDSSAQASTDVSESSAQQEHSAETSCESRTEASKQTDIAEEESKAAVSYAVQSTEQSSSLNSEEVQSSAGITQSESSITQDDSVCTLYISCINAVKNDSLDNRKREYLPADGIILASTQISFHSGDSVFDVLSRACRDNGIVLSAPKTPMYGTAYIEGISDLHERDCGPVSGWMYSVNGTFPSVGCSLYKPVDGDRIEIVYSCDLGRDVGNIYIGG